MTRDEHMWLKLMEECAEVQQRVSKLIQFGINEVEPGQSADNLSRLRLEIFDLLAVLQIIEDMNLMPFVSEGIRREELEAHTKAKRAKIQKFLDYSIQLGMVTR